MLTGHVDAPPRCVGRTTTTQVWVPFSEFRWANFFRQAVPGLAPGQPPDEPAVLEAAMSAAREPAASSLPGFITNLNPSA